MDSAEDRCVDFLNAIANVCAEHRVILKVDEDMPWECVEFVEKSEDPTGAAFISSIDDVADLILERFVEMHGLQDSI